MVDVRVIFVMRPSPRGARASRPPLPRAGGTPALRSPLPEEELLRGAAEQPVLVVVGEELQLRPHQVDAVAVVVPVRDLERAVALPHAAARAERLDHALDQ